MIANTGERYEKNKTCSNRWRKRKLDERSYEGRLYARGRGRRRNSPRGPEHLARNERSQYAT